MAFAMVVVIACSGKYLVPQQPHREPTSPLESLLRSHGHARPVPPNAPSTSQVIVDATTMGTPVLLDKNWRVGITANPAAATPEFDDSTWAVRDAKESFTDVPDEDHPSDAPQAPGKPSPNTPIGGHQRPYVWFRLHLKLPPTHGPISLLIELPVSHNTSVNLGEAGLAANVDVFANGKQIQPAGPHGDEPEHYQPISRVYHLNLAPNEGSLTLALRSIYIPTGIGSYTSFFSNRALRLGSPDDLERALQLWSLQILLERLPRLVYSILLTVLSLFLLALYFTQKGHVEYLWLALHELVQAPIGFVDLAGSSAWLDQLWYAAVVMQLVLISAYLYFEFLIAFLALRRRWYIVLGRYTAPVLFLVGPGLLMVGRSTRHIDQQIIGIFLVVVGVGTFLWIMGWFIFIFLTLIVATARRNFEAGLLLIPLVLSFVGMVEPVLTAGMTDWVGSAYHSPLTFQTGPVPIHFASIADFAGIFVIVLIIFVRFLRIHRDRERASSELAAARSVQELMIPHEKLETPGFEVDSVYNPANEVGGDFFHVQPTSDGGLLVIIGDVAGKGLQAAMNVSMLMGAMRRTPERSPAKILESLNRVLVGSESFTTCQAAWFGADGEVVLANAGHLPPYLNSQEIAIPGGLPLGVLPDVDYDEVRLYLHPGDRILLMSDGVVEARQSSGELFGFDRVHNLSNQTAFYIADAAKTFGQEDDITVVTVRRLAQAMAA
jgi:hypothetical protein